MENYFLFEWIVSTLAKFCLINSIFVHITHFYCHMNVNLLAMKQKAILLFLCTISFIGFGQTPNSKEIINQNGMTIPVYRFEEFKAILTPKNDTLYIINFWATWCQPCVAELPYFEQLNDSLKNKKAKIILVSIDSRKTAEAKLIPFIENKKLKNTVWLLNEPDFNSWLDKVSPEWSGSIPATIMIKGNVQNFYEQSFEFDQLKKITYQNLNQ
jgi:thiol-disulfide isomerase/thioredoxin